MKSADASEFLNLIPAVALLVVRKEDRTILSLNDTAQRLAMPDGVGRRCWDAFGGAPCESCPIDEMTGARAKGDAASLLSGALGPLSCRTARDIDWDGEPAYLITAAVPPPGEEQDERMCYARRMERLNGVLERANVNTGEQLRAIIDNIHIGIGIMEVSGPDIRVTHLNDAFSALTGLRDEGGTSFSQSIIQAVHPEDRHTVETLVNARARAGEPIELTFRTQVGSAVKTVTLTASRIDDQGLDEYVYSVTLIDITRRLEVERALKVSEKRMRIAMDLTGTVAWDYDFETQTITETDASMHRYGALKHTITGVPQSILLSGRIHSSSKDEYWAMYERMQRGEPLVSANVKARMADGRYVWERVRYQTIFDDAGRPYKAIGVSEDISEMREAQLRCEQEEQYRVAVATGATFSFDVDMTTNAVLGCAERFFARLGVNQGASYDLVARRFVGRLVHPDHQKGAAHFLDRERVLSDFEKGESEQSYEYQLREENGVYKWCTTTLHLFTSAESGHVCCFLYTKDCDTRKRRELMLKERAQSDPLTGLLNRGAYEHFVEDAFQGDPTVRSALFMLDLDDFKSINDTYGHICGDHVLTHIGARLKRLFRDSDAVGRLGGDEFSIFMHGVPNDALVRERAQALLRQVCNNYTVDGHDITVSCSIGVAFAPEHGSTFEELYRCADRAQYQAKQTGKNRYVLYQGTS